MQHATCNRGARDGLHVCTEIQLGELMHELVDGFASGGRCPLSVCALSRLHT